MRVTGIPDENPTELQRKYDPMVKYLEAELGTQVEYIPVTDYGAAVQALLAGKVDFAWLGGFTHVQARVLAGAIPLCMRDIDREFKSIFIAHSDSGIKSPADIKGKTFAFGSKSSTSGHLMPRHFLVNQFAIDPEHDLAGSPVYSGAHDATVKMVESGKVQSGALNIEVWERLLREKKVDTSKVVVIWTTPPYVDYVWTVREDMDPGLREKFKRGVPRARRRQAGGRRGAGAAGRQAVRPRRPGRLRRPREGRTRGRAARGLSGAPDHLTANPPSTAPPPSRAPLLSEVQQRTGHHPDPALFTMERHVADLEALRRHFGLARMTLVAHSFGPALAAAYAMKHPDRVARMIVIGPVPPRAGDLWQRYGAAMEARLGEDERVRLTQLEADMVKGADPVAACREYWSIAVKPRVARPDLAARITGDFCSAGAQAIRAGMGVAGPRTLESLGEWDFRAGLGRPGNAA